MSAAALLVIAAAALASPASAGDWHLKAPRSAAAGQAVEIRAASGWHFAVTMPQRCGGRKAEAVERQKIFCLFRSAGSQEIDANICNDEGTSCRAARLTLTVAAAGVAQPEAPREAPPDTPRQEPPKTTREGKPASQGYRLFWRVAHAGKKVAGDNKAGKRARPYYELETVKVMADGSRCEALFVTHESARLRALSRSGPMPLAVTDEGCTGTAATSKFEWAGQPEEVSQRRLDDIYEAVSEDLDAKARGK